MPVVRRSASRSLGRRSLTWLTAASLALGAPPLGVAEAAVDHLVVSEVVTGGASASDELIELHNPTVAALPLEGLELIYVSASGATIARRALWPLGSPVVPSGGHVLVANEAGIYAPVADATYASGMAATGGSVALRIQGAATAIDAVGWGNAASTWREGATVPAPAAGASLERRPGATLGSTQDTDDNLADFVERLVPEPQNLGSPPTPDPSATPSPLPSATPITPTPTTSAEPTASPSGAPTSSPSPTAAPISVAAARAAPDGTIATIEGVALTAHDFHDGGGFVTDGSGGIAVLLTDGAFARGNRVRVSGEVDDRFAQRTLRASSAGITLLGTGTDPASTAATTGSVSEAIEGTLVRVTGLVVGSPTELTTGVAFDLDDGSGPTRLVVDVATGIGTGGWASGTRLDLVGVAGQRDSSGGGSSGYRVMPRDATDILEVTSAASPSPTPSSAGGSPSPSAAPTAGGVLPIAGARRAAKNARVVIRGTVTLPTGLVDPRTAVVQDASGAILLRLGEEAGSLALGQRVELGGARSTKSGMESVRVTLSPRHLGAGTEPAPLSVRSGEAGEAHEALLVVARGALVASARRSSAGSVSFEIDDGSGPLRVSAAAALRLDDEPLVKGTWVEVRGVLGQETSGARPRAGYRIWPRSRGEVRVTAPVTDGGEGSGAGGGSSAGGPVGSLDQIGAADLAALRIGATLVAGPWRELGIGGLLWDGSRLVAIDAASATVVATLVRAHRLPLAVEVSGLRARGTQPVIGAPLVALGRDRGQVVRTEGPPSAPRGELDGPRPAWVSVVGRVTRSGSRTVLVVGEKRVPLDLRCKGQAHDAGMRGVTAIAVGDPVRLIVPCGGIRSVPALGGATPAVADVTPSGDAPAALVARPAAGPDSRQLAGALLLIAAGILVGVAVARRIRGGIPPGAPDASGAVDAASPAEPARLTLVNVPREHGP